MSESENRSPSFIQTVGSVLMAFLGVQSNANRERDFTKGRAIIFIAVGILMTVVLIVTLFTVVQMVLPE